MWMAEAAMVPRETPSQTLSSNLPPAEAPKESPLHSTFRIRQLQRPSLSLGQICIAARTGCLLWRSQLVPGSQGHPCDSLLATGSVPSRVHGVASLCQAVRDTPATHFLPFLRLPRTPTPWVVTPPVAAWASTTESGFQGKVGCLLSQCICTIEGGGAGG